MPALSLSKPVAAPVAQKATFLGAVKNLGRGLFNRTALFADYNAARPSATTRLGSRIGTNSNSTYANIQRVGMNWTAEDVYKNSCIAAAYIGQRVNYCSSMLSYIPMTGDVKLDAKIKLYLHGEDGTGGVFGSMGVDCSMQDAFSRTADIECPIRGDSGLIVWRDETDNIRLIEWSADQLGEIYNFTLPRVCGLAMDSEGLLQETAGSDCVYQSGRYFRGADCVAYKIYERSNSWYAAPRIYPAYNVIYFRDPSNFRGVRGVTAFATGLEHMEKGERLFQTGMDAALRQAKTAMMVFNGNGAPDEGTYATDELANGQVSYSERIVGGPLVEYFFTGDQAQFTSPDSPGPELIQGVETSDERVALSLNLPYAFLISATKVGGAPSRLEVEKAAKEWARIQNMIHRPRLARIRDIVIGDAVAKGILPPHPHIFAGRWNLPIAATVDAGYSAKENIDFMRAGIESPQALVAEQNRDWNDVLMEKKQAAIAVSMATQDANRDLKAAGYDEDVTKVDIAILVDNPQMPGTGVDAVKAEKKPEAKPVTAKLAAYMGDMLVGDLPAATQDEIRRILGTNGRTDALKVIKYGMVAPELERMADPHNLETATNNLRYSSNASCSDEVHSRQEKHILVNNGRVVDGHHYLAKALKGKVSKSLHVIDLTPTRFQTAKLKEFNEADHPRNPAGDDTGGEFKSVDLGEKSEHQEIKNGKPVVITASHGTDREFKEFNEEFTKINPSSDGLIWHGDVETAGNYGDRVIKSEISFKKPLVLDYFGTLYGGKPEKGDYRLSYNEDDLAGLIGAIDSDGVPDPNWMKHWKKKGYDGIIITNIDDRDKSGSSSDEAEPRTIVAPFSSKQISIKSETRKK